MRYKFHAVLKEEETWSIVIDQFCAAVDDSYFGYLALPPGAKAAIFNPVYSQDLLIVILGMPGIYCKLRRQSVLKDCQ